MSLSLMRWITIGRDLQSLDLTCLLMYFLEIGWRHASSRLKGPYKVALIREASQQSDRRRGSIRCQQQDSGVIDPKVADIVADCASIHTSKAPH